MIIKKYFTTLFICLGVLIGNMALAASSASAADAWVYEKNGNTMKEFREKLSVDFSFMSYAPFIFISAT